MVATGHGLYWAQLPSVLEKVDVLKLGSSRATQVYLLVQHDELADKSEVSSGIVYQDDRGEQTATLETEGVFSQESKRVDVDSFFISNKTNTDNVILLVGSYGLERVNDDLLRISIDKDGLELHLGFERSKDYRIYRGQRKIDNGADVTPSHYRYSNVTETITINGHNPYVIYRYTTVWHVESLYTELSIGTYPFKTVEGSDDFLVDSRIIESRGRGPAESVITTSPKEYNTRPASTDISYRFDGNTLSEINEDGEWRIDLQLVSDSDVWLEFEGDPQPQWGGYYPISDNLIKQLNNKGKTEVARIATELAQEMGRYNAGLRLAQKPSGITF